jgi:hypothetical protein
MPAVERHERNQDLVRFSANLKPDTKKALEDYAYRNRITLSVALERIVSTALVLAKKTKAQ